jgi:hypothetical protein
LQNKIAEMLRSVPKKDKENRKKLQNEIAKLETELKQRHEKELQQWETQHQTQHTVTYLQNKRRNLILSFIGSQRCNISLFGFLQSNVKLIETITNAKLMPSEPNPKKTSRAQRRRVSELRYIKQKIDIEFQETITSPLGTEGGERKGTSGTN